jgi:hypothetical protein
VGGRLRLEAGALRQLIGADLPGADEQWLLSTTQLATAEAMLAAESARLGLSMQSNHSTKSHSSTSSSFGKQLSTDIEHEHLYAYGLRGDSMHGVDGEHMARLATHPDHTRSTTGTADPIDVSPGFPGTSSTSSTISASANTTHPPTVGSNSSVPLLDMVPPQMIEENKWQSLQCHILLTTRTRHQGEQSHNFQFVTPVDFGLMRLAKLMNKSEERAGVWYGARFSEEIHTLLPKVRPVKPHQHLTMNSAIALMTSHNNEGTAG